jgi:DNA-binding MurR/RpiR family transcriptional regulator
MSDGDGRNRQNRLSQALTANYDRLGPSQRRVIDRLLVDTRYAAVVSAPELAQEVGVSESTVTRATQVLGFAGYPDFQANIRKQFFSPLSERVETGVMSLGDTPEAAAIQAIYEDSESIKRTAEDLSPELLSEVIERLVAAKRVFIFGSRGSYGLAQMLSIGLRLLLPDARLLREDFGIIGDQLATLGPNDLLVAISFRRVDRITVGAVRHASSVGATVIAISDALHSPIARLADCTLTARLGPLRLMPSYAAGASLVNAIITATSLQTLEDASERLQAAEKLWEEFAVHVDDE